ncbi:ribonuclease III [Selenomonas sp. TAMA-11512]|uniref:ribonuclease III n=1 Tax=Selenomonas sp. TAMA-11512 TaxID=3095337 RepID=UPI0030934913|nr:ribonuclease III [Selenomonas sp. TAMA-11512]
MQKITDARRKELVTLALKLGVTFTNIELLHEALIHTSYANEAKGKEIRHNERLEFLGDAVLELASSTYLFEHFPDRPEGEMTKARASIVCEPTLAKRAKELELGKHLLLGRGEGSTGGRARPSILCDAFEAIIGAIYLDQGWQTAFDYVLRELKDEFLSIDSGENLQDYKTLLQEHIQKKSGQTISYELVDEQGPDHEKAFFFVVRINDKICGRGEGPNKKLAEQRAAKAALEKLGRL